MKEKRTFKEFYDENKKKIWKWGLITVGVLGGGALLLASMKNGDGIDLIEGASELVVEPTMDSIDVIADVVETVI